MHACLGPIGTLAIATAFTSRATPGWAADVVIDFENLAPNAIVTDQYRPQGVAFADPGYLPFAVKVPAGKAQSGTTVVNISCAPGCAVEFPVALSTDSSQPQMLKLSEAS